MIKHCKICGLEISDTDYDSWHRFISVKYCDDCRIAQRKKSQKEAKRRYDELIADLIATMQLQNKRIEELEQKINVIEP